MGNIDQLSTDIFCFSSRAAWIIEWHMKSRVVVIVRHLPPVRGSEQTRVSNSTRPRNLRLRYQNIEPTFRPFPWLYDALLAVSWSRVTVPFEAKRTKHFDGIILIEVSRNRSKFIEFDGIWWNLMAFDGIWWNLMAYFDGPGAWPIPLYSPFSDCDSAKYEI
jgi:hypothetical protein